MWEYRLVKLIKKGKFKIIIRNVYFSSDGSIGAISDKNYCLESESLKELQDKINFIQTNIFGRPVVIYETEKNRIYTKVG